MTFDLDLQIFEMFPYEWYLKHDTTWDNMHIYRQTKKKKREVGFPESSGFFQIKRAEIIEQTKKEQLMRWEEKLS